MIHKDLGDTSTVIATVQQTDYNGGKAAFKTLKGSVADGLDVTSGRDKLKAFYSILGNCIINIFFKCGHRSGVNQFLSMENLVCFHALFPCIGLPIMHLTFSTVISGQTIVL